MKVWRKMQIRTFKQMQKHNGRSVRTEAVTRNIQRCVTVCGTVKIVAERIANLCIQKIKKENHGGIKTIDIIIK